MNYFNIIITLGLVLIVIGLGAYFFFGRDEKESKNRIKVFNLEFEISKASITIIVLGMIIFLFPLLTNNKDVLESEWSNNKQNDNTPVTKIITIEDANYKYRQKKYEIAFGMYKKLMEKGNSEAQWHYGEMLYHGEGVSPNPKIGIQLIEKSANNGCANAQGILGMEYLQGGKGVNRNLDIAKHYFNLAVKENNIYGFYGLGVIANDDKRYTEAVDYFKKAAKKGLIEAQLHLSNTLLDQIQEYVNKNKDKSSMKLWMGLFLDAIKWSRKAAEQGNVQSMLLTAELYYEKWTISKSYNDITEACYFYKLYIFHEEINNVNQLNHYEKALNEVELDDIKRINKLIEGFQPKLELLKYHTHLVD